MQYPDCKNLIDSGGVFKTCELIANYTGGLSGRVVPAMCQSTCKMFGPYCGKKISKEEEAKFVSKIFIFDFSATKFEFLKRILGQYLMPVKIRYPEKEWIEIKKSLKPFVDSGEISKIYLTGSLLIEKENHKDFDILLKINTWKNHKIIKDRLPKTIMGKNCDYFFTSLEEMHDRTFCVMDCDEKILYTTSWYELKIESLPDFLTVKKSEPLHINKYIQEELKKNLNIFSGKSNKEFSSSQLEAKINWKTVESSWKKAISFLKSNISLLTKEKISDELLKQRIQSCFGNGKDLKECEVLSKSDDGNFYCGACGCGKSEMTKLSNSENENSFNKLHYPYLECPLNKKGFNNYVISTKS